MHLHLFPTPQRHIAFIYFLSTYCRFKSIFTRRYALCQYPSLTFGFICFLVITFPPCVSLLYFTRDEMIPPLFLFSCLFSFASLPKHSLHCIALGSVWRSCARSLFSNGHCLIYC